MEFFEIGDERARRLFSMGAEQVLDTARQARETVAEMQRQFGRMAEQQTIGITEEVRDRMREIGRYTEQGLADIRDIAVSEAEQAATIAQQSLDYGDGASGQQERPRNAPTGSLPPDRQAGANEWAPRFEATEHATNGAQEAMEEEQGDATEANAANEGRVQNESRTRARR